MRRAEGDLLLRLVMHKYLPFLTAVIREGSAFFNGFNGLITQIHIDEKSQNKGDLLLRCGWVLQDGFGDNKMLKTVETVEIYCQKSKNKNAYNRQTPPQCRPDLPGPGLLGQ